MELWTDWHDIDSLQGKLDQLVNPDMTPIMMLLEQVIYTDNRDGILAGTDGHGAPMPTTIRETLPEGHDVFYKLPNGKIGHYWQAGRSGTHPEDGSGKPLDPHGLDSRVIANLRTGHFMDSPGEWIVFGAWENVLSSKGVEFLPFHFQGQGRLPVRDLASLRPDGVKRAVALVEQWMMAVLAGQAADNSLGAVP